MAEIANMKVTVGADLSELQQALSSASKDVSQFTVSLAKVSQPLTVLTSSQKGAADGAKNLSNALKSISSGSVSKDLASTAIAATKLDSTLGNQLPKGANQAGIALMNLGRVAQDAPFGFIGIQNNINPLLESFQRLKTETGSTKGALAALSSSLMGGAGLGLAVSVVTGLLTVMAQNGFFKTEKAADDAAKKIEDYKKAVTNIFENAGQEAAQVQSLIVVLNSETETRQRKLAALEQLKDINPEIFGQLKSEGGLVAGLDKAYKQYIDNIKTVVAAKIQQQKLEKITTQILEKEGATQTALQRGVREGLANYDKQLKANAALLGVNIGATAADKEKAQTQKELNALYVESASIISDLSRLSGGIKIDPFKLDSTKDKKDKVVGDVDEITKAINKLNKELAGITGLQSIGQLSPANAEIERVKAYDKAFRSLLELKVDPSSNTIQDLLKSYNNLVPNITKTFPKTKETIEAPVEVKPVVTVAKDFDPFAITESIRTALIAQAKKAGISKVKGMPIDIAATVDIKGALDQIQGQIEAFNKSMVDIINTTMNNAFAGIGEGLAEAINGGGVGAAFKGLLNIISDGIIQMGKSMIALGTAKSIIEKFNLAPGATTVIAGIGTVALGTLLKNAIPKFAAGGIVTGPLTAVVGEAGPEAIIPLDKLGKIMGGGQQVFIPNMVLRGQDIYVSFNRAAQQRGRNG